MSRSLSAVLLVILATSAAQASPPHLQWDHESRAVMTESITALGGGQYHYGYTLANNDVTGIWMFIVYLPYQIGLDDEAPTWHKQDWGWLTLLPELSGAYDPRNVAPSIRCVAEAVNNTHDGWYGTDPIAVGETVSGFGFIASVYDPTPKLYIYELDGNRASQSGKVSALGHTVIPEPSSLLALFAGLGGLGGMIRRRKK